MKSLLIVLLILLLPPTAQAGLDEEMGALFTDMLNATPGGYYESQRRGVITGGNLAMRNKVTHPNLVSFVPPSFKGGCGGIDLFGGSFSYINGTQITQLLRSISQGAVGYAFQLAIEGMCPTCSQVMTKLQKDIAQINAIMKNSCEASKSVVNATGLNAWHDKRLNDAADLDTSRGFLPDFHEAKESKNPNQVAIASGAADEITGNVVHEALNDASAMNWFVNGDDQLKRVLMSLTGTMVTGKKDDNSDVKYDFRPPLIKTRDFIEGGDLKVYKCESDECLLTDSDPTETVRVTGMRSRVRTMIFGSGTCAACAGGIFRKIAHRDGGQVFDANEEKFIQSASPGILGLVNRLSIQPGSAALVADRMVDILATELTHQIIDEMFDTVRNSVTATGRPLDSSMLEVMRDLRQQINEERRIVGQSTAAISTVLDMHQNIEQSLRNHAFHKAQ